MKGCTAHYKPHLGQIFVAIATLTRYAITDELIMKTSEAVTPSQCKRVPSGSKSLGGCIAGNFKMGNI